MSPFQKRSAKAFQVCEQGFLNRCHRVHAQRGAPQRQNKKKKGGGHGGDLCFVAIAVERRTTEEPFFLCHTLPVCL